LIESIEYSKSLGEKTKIITGSDEMVVEGRFDRVSGKMTSSTKIQIDLWEEIVALHAFLFANQDVTQEDLDELLKKKFFKFRFLRDVNRVIPNLRNELLNHDNMYVASRYLHAKSKQNQREKTLP